MLSKQKVAASSDELKYAETDWKMESENIVKTQLKFIIGIAEMSLDQVVKILDKQLANDYYLLFTKALQSRISSYCTSPTSGPL